MISFCNGVLSVGISSSGIKTSSSILFGSLGTVVATGVDISVVFKSGVVVITQTFHTIIKGRTVRKHPLKEMILVLHTQELTDQCGRRSVSHEHGAARELQPCMLGLCIARYSYV